MSEYDGHDDYDREFRPRPAAEAVADFVAKLIDFVLAVMAGLVVGRWAFIAVGPEGWAWLFALLVGTGVFVVAALIAGRVLGRMRDADALPRLGLRLGIVVVFVVAFAMPLARVVDAANR